MAGIVQQKVAILRKVVQDRSAQIEAEIVTLDRREAELLGTVTSIRAQRKGLRAELRSLQSSLGESPAAESSGRGSTGRSPETIMSQILAVLAANPREGVILSSAEILAQVNKARREGTGMIPRTAFSPQLSRLVRTGEIARNEDGYYYLRAAPRADGD